MKKFIWLFALLALILCLAACRDTPAPSTTAPEETEATDDGTTLQEESRSEPGSVTEPESASESESESESEETEPPADETTTNLPVANEADFRPGVWWALGNEIDCYYEICADGTGAVIRQEDGLGVGMNYESFGDTVTFHKGGVDASETARVTANADGTLTMTFADRTETWSYMGNVTMNGFTFYSNEQLCRMAREYLTAKEGYTVNSAAARADETDPRQIAVQLYDNMGDHNSTAAWYYVDRFTAKGTDLMENPVDLNQP